MYGIHLLHRAMRTLIIHPSTHIILRGAPTLRTHIIESGVGNNAIVLSGCSRFTLQDPSRRQTDKVLSIDWQSAACDRRNRCLAYRIARKLSIHERTVHRNFDKRQTSAASWVCVSPTKMGVGGVFWIVEKPAEPALYLYLLSSWRQ